MSVPARHFFAIAIPAGAIGIALASVLGWGENGVFAAAMIPLAVVMLIFILREPADRTTAGDAESPQRS